jgi:hypothetical protein
MMASSSAIGRLSWDAAASSTSCRTYCGLLLVESSRRLVEERRWREKGAKAVQTEPPVAETSSDEAWYSIVYCFCETA